AVARAAGSVVGDLTSARDVPGSVRIHRAPAADLVGVAARAAEAAVEGAADASGEGRVAVIAPPALTGAVRQELSRGPAAQALHEGDADLRKPLNVLSPRDVKGLEFDRVVVVEPAQLLAEGGPGDLYVALTRPTYRLDVVHAQDLPAGFEVVEGGRFGAHAGDGRA